MIDDAIIAMHDGRILIPWVQSYCASRERTITPRSGRYRSHRALLSLLFYVPSADPISIAPKRVNIMSRDPFYGVIQIDDSP